MVSNGFASTEAVLLLHVQEKSANGMRQLAGTLRLNRSGMYRVESQQYRRADATPLAESQPSALSIVSPMPKFRQTTLTC
jgi:hypothetical protein